MSPRRLAMNFSTKIFLFLSLAANAVVALSPSQWRAQSIYQILTDRFARTDGSTTATCNTEDQVYCGGTWQGIINKLGYIQGMGFTAIWISPVVKQLEGNSGDGSSYHGYWAQDIYALNSHFGSESDLIALSAAVHARGMYLMVDIVTNHMAYLGCGNCVDYSIFNPFNQKSYYHDFCLINYNDQNSIKNCWMGSNTVSLPDMRSEDPGVLAVWQSWIKDLVAKYSIDGLRLDSAQQVDNGFFAPFQSSAGVHMLGEVFNGDPAYVCPYQTRMSGVLNFPAHFWITQAFQSTSGSISNLVNGINNMKSTCSDTTLLGSFMENHDLARFPSLTQDMSLVKNAIAFTILQDGSPIIYYGQEQHYAGGDVPNDREALWYSGYSNSSTLYTWIATLNRIRTRAVSQSDAYLLYKAYPVYSDGTTIVMRKGDTGSQIISVFSNRGASAGTYTLALATGQTGFSASQALTEITSCTALTTDSSGSFTVTIANGLPRVFYPTARLAGSGICNGGASTTSSAPSTSTSTCSLATAVAVTFQEKVTTVVGQTIKITGNSTVLGNWNANSAVSLSASQYTNTNPLWTVTLSFPPATVIQYKFIRFESSGTSTWEADPNHTYTVPRSCATAVTVDTTWQTTALTKKEYDSIVYSMKDEVKALDREQLVF